ncbi:MAG: oxidoreductase [Bacteroidota bacterium]
MEHTFNIDGIPSQKGRLAIVTGANTGLGYETALALAKKDFEVVIACRNMEKAEDAKERIKREYPDAKLMCIRLDLSKQNSIRTFVDEFHLHYDQLDLLINNAGIMMTPYKITEDGFENQLASNYLGHFTLVHLLLKTLEKTKGSRVVMVSSLAHKWNKIRFDDINFKKGYDPRQGYGQSKLACLMFAYILDRRLKEHNFQLRATAAHPGITITNLINHFNPIIKFLAGLLSPLFFESTANAALPIVRAALDPDVLGGEYFGLSGWREYKGKPVRVNSNKRSKDEEAQKRLWKLSEELTGVKFFG